MTTLILAIGWVLLSFVTLLGLAIVVLIVRGTIDLSRLISEPTGDASMARFQLLIFTFVVGLSLFLVIVGKGDVPPSFPPQIPGGILALLGISASSYLVSKGIQFSTAEGVEDRPPTVTATPGSAHVTAPGQKIQFSAEVIRATNKDVTWSVFPNNGSVGSIDPVSGLYTAPDALPAGGALATIKATSVADASAFGAAAVTL
jgi:hypothetical protein